MIGDCYSIATQVAHYYNKIEVQVMAVARPRNHCYLHPLAFGQGVFVFAHFTQKVDD